MHNCKERARRRPQKGKSQEDSLCVVVGRWPSSFSIKCKCNWSSWCKVQEGEEQAQEYINPFIGLTLFVINIIIIFILNECNESLCRVSFWWWTRWRGSSGELLGIDQSDHIPQHCVPSTLHWLHPLCHSILLLKMVSMEKQINQIYTFSIFPFLYVNKF